MEYRLVVKNSDGLYTIYLTILSKVLVGRVVLNFYFYEELFSFINLTYKNFYTFILNQKALEIGYSDFLIFNILYTSETYYIPPFVCLKNAQLTSNLASYKYSISFNNYFKIDFYKGLYNCLIVNINYTLYYIAYYGHYMFDQSSYGYINWPSQLSQLKQVKVGR